MICSQIQSYGPISSIKSVQNVALCHRFHSPRVQVRAVWFRGSVLMLYVTFFSFLFNITSIVKMILFGQFLSYKSGIKTKPSYWIQLLTYPIVAVGGKSVVVAQTRSAYYNVWALKIKNKLFFLHKIWLWSNWFEN